MDHSAAGGARELEPIVPRGTQQALSRHGETSRCKKQIAQGWLSSGSSLPF